MQSIVFYVCIVLTVCVCAENDLQSYVASIKLYLKEEEIPKLITESIFGNDAALTRHFRLSKVSLSDIIEAVGTSEISFNEVLEELNIKLEDIYKLYNWNWTNVKQLLTFADLNIPDIYYSFKNKLLKDPKKDVQKILKVLNINANDFDKALVGGERKEVMEVLSTGRYSRTNIETLLKIASSEISLSDVLEFLKYIKFERIVLKLRNNSKTRSIIDDLKNLITPSNALKLTKVFNLTASNFYANEAFADFLKHVTDFNERVIGTAVSSNEIITFMYQDFLKKYTRLVAETLDNSSEQYDIREIIYNSPNVATLITTKTLQMQFIKIPETFNKKLLKNCTYVSISDGLLYTEEFTPKLDSNILFIMKTNSSIFNLGSPLLCGNYLYGVANWEDEHRIEFVPVYQQKSTYDTSENSSKLLNFLKLLSEFALGDMWSVCEYLNVSICANRDDNSVNTVIKL